MKRLILLMMGIFCSALFSSFRCSSFTIKKTIVSLTQRLYHAYRSIPITTPSSLMRSSRLPHTPIPHNSFLVLSPASSGYILQHVTASPLIEKQHICSYMLHTPHSWISLAALSVSGLCAVKGMHMYATHDFWPVWALASAGEALLASTLIALRYQTLQETSQEQHMQKQDNHNQVYYDALLTILKKKFTTRYTHTPLPFSDLSLHHTEHPCDTLASLLLQCSIQLNTHTASPTHELIVPEDFSDTQFIEYLITMIPKTDAYNRQRTRLYTLVQELKNHSHAPIHFIDTKGLLQAYQATLAANHDEGRFEYWY